MVVKLVLIFCYFDALCMLECVTMLKKDVHLTARDLLAKVIWKKTDQAALRQTFIILNIPNQNYNPVKLYKEYLYLRERNIHERL